MHITFIIRLPVYHICMSDNYVIDRGAVLYLHAGMQTGSRRVGSAIQSGNCCVILWSHTLAGSE